MASVLLHTHKQIRTLCSSPSLPGPLGLFTRPCIWGVAHLAVALVGGLAYSHHTALFYTQGSPLTFLALVLLACVTPRVAPPLHTIAQKRSVLVVAVLAKPCTRYPY